MSSSLPADSVSLAPRAAARPLATPLAAAAALATCAVALSVLRSFMGKRPIEEHAHLVWTPELGGTWLGVEQYFTAIFVRIDAPNGLEWSGPVQFNKREILRHLERVAAVGALTVRTAYLRAWLADPETWEVVAIAGVTVQRLALLRILEAADMLGAAGERVQLYASPGSLSSHVDADDWHTLVVRSTRYVGLATALVAKDGDEGVTAFEPERVPQPAAVVPEAPLERAPERPAFVRASPRLHTPALRVDGTEGARG